MVVNGSVWNTSMLMPAKATSSRPPWPISAAGRAAASAGVRPETANRQPATSANSAAAAQEKRGNSLLMVESSFFKEKPRLEAGRGLVDSTGPGLARDDADGGEGGEARGDLRRGVAGIPDQLGGVDLAGPRNDGAGHIAQRGVAGAVQDAGRGLAAVHRGGDAGQELAGTGGG